jgi:glycolate oxidase FAD binding subunit
MAAEETTASFAGSPLRDGVAADEIHGVRPAAVVLPGTAEAVAAVLAEAARARRSVVIRGRGSRHDWGRVPRPIALLLDMSRMDRIRSHEHGDLTATVEAGATLADVNAALSTRGQWLPVDTAFAHATIGGTLASADSGALRHRFGTLRDLVIGVTLATTEGALVRAGGQVVKNVAGYDLGKLLSGSFGSYAALVNATFKLAPTPAHSTTLVAEFEGETSLGLALQRIRTSQVEPMALDLHVICRPASPPSVRLLVRLASTPRAVSAQLDALKSLLAGASLEEGTGEGEGGLWREQVPGPWMRPGAVLRVSWRPSTTAELISRLRAIATADGVSLELAGRAAVGAGVVRVDAPDAGIARIVEQLRAWSPAIGAVSILRGSTGLKTQMDVWGDMGPSVNVARALKQAFDPADVLGAGRGVV